MLASALALHALLATLLFPVPATAHEGLHAVIAKLDERLASAPDDVDLLLQRGEAHRRHHAWSAAFEDVIRIRMLAPQRAEGLLLHAELHADMGWFDTALPLLDRYLKDCPGNLDARWLRGQVHAALGESADAERDWDAVIAARPKPSPDEYLERAMLLASRGPEFVDHALAGLNEGILRLGEATAIQLRAIDLELQRGRPDDALARLSRIANWSARQERWLSRRGDILLGSGRPEQALVAYREASAAIDALRPRHRLTPAVQELARHVAQRLEELDT